MSRALSRPLFVTILFLLVAGVSGVYAQDGLTETFVASDGSYSLHYPAGWVYEVDSSGLILANSADSLAAFEQGGQQIPAGTLIVLRSDDLDQVSNGQTQAGVDYTPLTAAAIVHDSWVAMDTANVIESPVSLTIGGHDAARIRIANAAQKLEGIFLITDVDGTLNVFLALGAVGEVTAAEPTIMSIVESLEMGVAQVQPTLPPPLLESTPIAYGDRLDGAITSAGGQHWTFVGSADDIVEISVTAVDFDSMIELWGPNGAMLVSDDDSGGNLNPLISNFTLPASGTYTVVVRAYRETDVGPYTLTLLGFEMVEPGMISYGDSVTADLLKGTGDRWTFVGAAGDLVTVRMTSDFDNYLELHDAEGAVLRTDDDSGGSANATISAYALPADGTYTIIARSYNNTTVGRYGLSLTLAVPEPPSVVATGSITHALLDSPLGDQWLFDGEEGQRVTIAMVGTFDTVLELYGPDETLVATNDDTEIYSTSVIESVMLPATGQYRVVARSYAGGVGPYLLMISMPEGVTTGGL